MARARSYLLLASSSRKRMVPVADVARMASYDFDSANSALISARVGSLPTNAWAIRDSGPTIARRFLCSSTSTLPRFAQR